MFSGLSEPHVSTLKKNLFGFASHWKGASSKKKKEEKNIHGRKKLWKIYSANNKMQFKVSSANRGVQGCKTF